MARAHHAGIRIHVVTGDNGVTAAAIARQVGIGGDLPRIVTGSDLDQMTEHDLDELLATGQEVVFARSSPETKLRITDALRAQGQVVAMTGDGVNDAPALRRADIGIAMGRSGTDVAREASTMVLTDDDFATIIAAVEAGRRVYDNIRKFILYIFAHAVPEVAPFLIFALSGGLIPLPLTVLQILAIDLGTDTLPALALSRDRTARPSGRYRPDADPGVSCRSGVRRPDQVHRSGLLPGRCPTVGRASRLDRVTGRTVLASGGALPTAPADRETRLIRQLVDSGTIVVCAGGGGVPTVRDERTGHLRGVEAVVDKDLASAMLAEALDADVLLLLTDVPAVMTDFGTPAQKPIRETTPAQLRAQQFPAGSMGPKIDAVCRFVELTGVGAFRAVETVVTTGPAEFAPTWAVGGREQHRLQLAGVPEGELPQQGADRRGRVHPIEQCGHPAGTHHVDIVDTVRARAHARITTWIADFYNTARRHSANDGVAPIPFEHQMATARAV